MMRKVLAAVVCGAAVMLAVAPGATRTDAATKVAVEPGRFVWHDLMTRDVAAAKRFYGGLLGWTFEDTKRSDRPYVLAKLGSEPVAGIVDISEFPKAGTQWISFMAVADVDAASALIRSSGGRVVVDPRDLKSVARVALVTDPQGAPLGLVKPFSDRPDHAQPKSRQFFWDEFLARDATQALDFYKRLAGYTSKVTDARLGLEYHVLQTTRGRAGLFQLPPSASEVEPNWLPYILVDDPAPFAGRVATLGGRVVLPPAPERRNNSLAVVADPGGAVFALQKYPF
jgi:predicted enzyme related to lactoylglutathione lyase